MTPADAMRESDRLHNEARAAAARLRAIPGVGSGAMGLTPDVVKARPDYRAAKAESDRAFAALRAFNGAHAKALASARRLSRDNRAAPIP